MSDKDMKLRLIVEAKNEADAALNDLNAGLGRTGKNADQLRGSMSLLTVAAKGALAALAAAVTASAASRLVSLADAYTLAEGRLRLVTGSSAELAAVQDQLFASAQRTRSEYLSVVEAYVRLAQNTKELYLAQADLLTINETLNKAFIISGATEMERSSTMIQLSQAFSAGVLRGQEFNSVALQGSRVLQMLADYTGKSRSELRAMAEDGQLTTDVLVRAILAGATQVNEEFGKLPTTVGQARTVLNDTLSRLVSDANASSGATEGLSAAIVKLANTIDANRETILSLFAGIVEGSGNAFDAVMQKVNRVRGVVAALNGELGFAQQAGMGQAELRAYFEAVDHGVGRIHARLSAARQELAAMREGGDDGVRQALQQEIRSLEFAMQQAKEVRKALTAASGPEKTTGGQTGSGTFEQTSLDKKGLEELTKAYLPLVQAQREYEAALSKISLARQAGQLTEEQEKAARQEAQRQLEQSRQAYIRYTETREQALARERDAALALAQTEEERQAVNRRYQQNLAELRERVAKTAESAAKQAAREAERQQREYQAILDRLLPLEVAQREYNEALAALDTMDPTHQTERYQTALANLNREFEAARKRAGEYARALEDAQRAARESELARQGTAIEISMAQGNLSETDALPFQIDLLEQRLKLQQDLLADMRKSTPEEINAWNSQAEAIARTTLELAEYQQRLRLLDPAEAFKQGLKDYGMATNRDLLVFYGSALPKAMDASTEAISHFFRDFAQGNATLGESWKALGKTIEDTVFDILQELLQLQLRMAVLGGLGVTATGGTTGGGLLGLFGAQHGGGTIGVDPPTFTRAVPLSTFMHAPRFHTGLKGNEFPAILEHGESVLTEGQMAAIGKGLSASSGAPQVSLTVIEAPGVKAETETRQNDQGGIDVVVRMVEGRLVNRMDHGQGLHKTMASRYGVRRRF